MRGSQDIGGSMGACCVALCQAHPHITAVTCDLPAVHATAAAYVARHLLTHRVQVADLDFFSNDPFPACDVIIMGMVLHDCERMHIPIACLRPC
jgi:hypothetical protein